MITEPKQLDIRAARKELEQYRDQMQSFKIILERIDRLLMAGIGIINPPPSGTPPRQKHEKSKTMADYNAECEDLQKEYIEKERQARNAYLLNIQSKLHKVGLIDLLARNVLESRYVLLKTVEQMCAEYNFSYKQMQRKVKYAIAKFAEVNEIYIK